MRPKRAAEGLGRVASLAAEGLLGALPRRTAGFGGAAAAFTRILVLHRSPVPPSRPRELPEKRQSPPPPGGSGDRARAAALRAPGLLRSVLWHPACAVARL